MSLVDEFKAKQKVGDYPDHDEVADEIGAEQVHYDILNTTRWGQIVEYVYKRNTETDTEYARVRYEEAGGEGETYYEPTWTAVRPVTKSIVDYVDLD